MIKVVTDQLPGEPDIVSPNKYFKLRFRCEDGREIVIDPPLAGWKHESILLEAERFNEVVEKGFVWDAFLGEHWIGSTEV